MFLHASDTDGRSLLGRFQTKAQDLEVDDHEVKVEKVEEFEPGQKSYREILKSLKSCQARVYFLYARLGSDECSKKSSKVLFQQTRC